jgi:hypothetical protein
VSDKVSEASETIELGAENKRIALLIAALALALAMTEVAGDDAKTEAQMQNVASANLWAFFQARTIRQTVLSAEATRRPSTRARPTMPPAARSNSRWRGGAPPSRAGKASRRPARGGGN